MAGFGFLWLLIRRDGQPDPTQAPRPPAAPRFTLPPLPGPEGIPPDVLAELRRLLANDQKIQAIRRLRELIDCGLPEAKEWVERLWIEPSLIPLRHHCRRISQGSGE